MLFRNRYIQEKRNHVFREQAPQKVDAGVGSGGCSMEIATSIAKAGATTPD